jgi:hypothetical protein
VRLSIWLTGLAGSLLMVSAADAATLQAAYIFNNNLNAQEGGVPALAATDPLATNAFSSDTVFGGTHSVYFFNSSAGNNAGLTFNNGGNLISPGSYSLEMVFQLSGSAGYRRLVDSQNRQSDNGAYVDPSNHYDLFPSAAGTANFVSATYVDYILTNDGTNVNVYANGTPDFNIADSQMNLNNANNPAQLLNFFLDNTAGGGTGEFSGGRIALLELWDGVLTGAQARTLSADPFANVPATTTTGMPEPGTWLLLTAGAVCTAFRRRK